MELISRKATQTHLVIRGVEKTEVTISNKPLPVRVVQSASPIPLGGVPPSYDQTSPTDGISVVGDTLRIDIDSLPSAD